MSSTWYLCPHLKGKVELTTERKQHIAVRHPDLLPAHKSLIKLVLAKPDKIRSSNNFPKAKLLSRWFENLKGGKYLVVVVVSDHKPIARNWIITAYITRKLAK